MVSAPEPARRTPFHRAHRTKVAGLTSVKGGDCRFYNNLFVGRGESSGNGEAGFGLAAYDRREYPLQTGGNIFYNRARPVKADSRAD